MADPLKILDDMFSAYKRGLTMTELKPCPNCKSKKLMVWRIAPPKGRRFHVECDECHWCGETKLFKFRAIRAWNKEANNG